MTELRVYEKPRQTDDANGERGVFGANSVFRHQRRYQKKNVLKDISF